MLKFNEEKAVQTAVEIAKIVCANPKYGIEPCEQSAEQLADFIRTLENRFLMNDTN